MYMQTSGSFMERLSNYKARYPLIFAIGLFVFIQALTHDGAIYSMIERGETDANSIHDLYFPYWSNSEGTTIAQAAMGGIVFLVVFAILIRIAQRKHDDPLRL